MTDRPARGTELLTGQPVEGELLAELLEGGPLAPELALRYAISIGKALCRAHDAGAVHGSLSPWSIVVGARGATILEPVANDPHAGSYTSPEQIRGQAPDRRSDVFAYGAVLYEMAAGRPPFTGEPGEVRMAILGTDPPKLAAASPALAAVESVITDCLDKEPLRRRQRLQNAVVELKLATRYLVNTAPASPRRAVVSAGVSPRNETAPRFADRSWTAVPPEDLPPPAFSKRRRMLLGGAVLLMVAAASLFAGRLIFRQRAANPVLKFPVPPEANSSFPGAATVSPDGRYIVYSAVGPDGRRLLWLRALDQIHARIVPGTEDAAAPFWSDDSRSVGYFAGRSLKIWNLRFGDDGGPAGEARALCPADATAGGGTWNAGGVIVFSPGLNGGLYRIDTTGGDPQLLLALDNAKQHRSYRWPHFLPDGRHFTFFALGASDTANGVYAGDLQTREAHLLFSSDSDAVYSGDVDANPGKFGYLLFVQNSDVYAQAFNPSILELEGKPNLFLRDVGSVETLSLAPLSVSGTGLLVYQTIAQPTHQLAWLDREGKQIGTLGEPGEWGVPRVSPDGRRVICGKLAADRKRGELWLFDKDTVSRLVAIPGADARSPLWSPDGTRIAFTANPGGLYNVYLKALNGPDPGEPLFRSEYSKYLTDWSRDGRYLLFNSLATAGTSSDVWAYSFAEGRGGAVVETVHSEGYPALSPDGHWLAYQSDESGHDEVYVQVFDGISAGTKRRFQVSAGGGRLPRWRADGQELFFLSGPGSVMSVSVSAMAGGFSSGPPRKLFETRAIPKKSNLYDVSPDGQQLLFNLPYEWAGPSPITVMTNWVEVLRNP